MLLLSLLGTSISLAIFASAKTAAVLFVARILDGITGGNVSVAQAIVADSTKPGDRAKAFGVLGAAFGFGFTFGPAIGGLLSQWFITAPFWFSSVLALAGTIIGFLVLEETNLHREKKSLSLESIDPRILIAALKEPAVGLVLLVSFITLVSQNTMIIGFNSQTVDILKLNPARIGFVFTIWGIATLVMRGYGIKVLVDKVKPKEKIITFSLILSTLLLFLVAASSGYTQFVITVVLYAAAFAPVNTVLTSMLSERTNQEDQGGILGINQAYTALAQIIGPLLAGLIVIRSTSLVFTVSAILLIISLVVHYRLKPVVSKLNL